MMFFSNSRFELEFLPTYFVFGVSFYRAPFWLAVTVYFWPIHVTWFSGTYPNPG